MALDTDQGCTGASHAYAVAKALQAIKIIEIGATISHVCVVPDEEPRFEPVVQTSWILESKRYDRINARRKYLSEIARAKRHFGLKKPKRRPKRVDNRHPSRKTVCVLE